MVLGEKRGDVKLHIGHPTQWDLGLAPKLITGILDHCLHHRASSTCLHQPPRLYSLLGIPEHQAELSVLYSRFPPALHPLLPMPPPILRANLRNFRIFTPIPLTGFGGNTYQHKRGLFPPPPAPRIQQISSANKADNWGKRPCIWIILLWPPELE